MRRFLLIVSIVLVCTGIVLAEVRTEVGMETNWLISEQLALQFNGGMYAREDQVQPYSQGELLYFLETDTSGAHLFLKAKKDWPANEEYRWGFEIPVHDVVDLQVGFRGCREAEEWRDQIVLQTNWENCYGSWSIESAVGSAEPEYLLAYNYPLVYQLGERLTLKADVGAEYRRQGVRGEGVLPGRLATELHLAEATSFQAEAQYRYSLTKKSSDLTLGFYLQQRFQFYGKAAKPELATEVTTEVELEEVTAEPTAQEVEVIAREIYEIPEAPETPTPEKVMEPTQELAPVTKAPQVREVESKSPARGQAPVYDAQNHILTYKGQQVQMKGKKQDERLHLPIRYTFESLGGKVYWDERAKQIYVVFEGRNLLVDLEKNHLMFDGQTYALDQPVHFKGHYYLGQNLILKILEEYFYQSV